MLNGRLYRAALVPVLLALALAAFSLHGRPAPLTSSLAPDAFDGGRASAELHALAREFPNRAPGSEGDHALALHIAHELEEMGSGGAGFHVSVRHIESQTVHGRRALLTVIARRPGASERAPIVLLAHRDAIGAGSEAALSGTAVLLELARALVDSAPQRGIVIVSTSGGSAGAAGAADLAQLLGGEPDAALVLGNVAGTVLRKPFVLPYSQGLGGAPDQLWSTVSRAIGQELGENPGDLPITAQLVHLALPLSAGEQGVLNAAGIPAVALGVSGERGPAPDEPVSVARLQAFGKAALESVFALDSSPDVGSPSAELLVQRKAVPRWAVALVVLALLLAPLVATIDGVARARRRRVRMLPWLWWALSCALPFLVCILFAKLLGAMGVIPAPPAPVPGSAIVLDGKAVGALLALAMALVGSWAAWPSLPRRAGASALPHAEAAAIAMPLVLVICALLVWIANPFAALLIVPATHLWLLLAAPEVRPGRAGGLGLVALALVPLALVLAVHASELGLGPAPFAWSAAMLAAGAHLGVGGTLAWSVALGCTAGAALLALAGPREMGLDDEGTPLEITTRGPLGYAGPGSLGGTGSALRRRGGERESA
ncbi:MAG: M28 family peptidase [Solirubrobacterales bacterium]|nr:M28 family peptidase [Solirubrobacterales bacterium]